MKKIYILGMMTCLFTFLLGCTSSKKIDKNFSKKEIELAARRGLKFALIDSITKLYPVNTQLAVCYREKDGMVFKGIIHGPDRLTPVINQDSIFEIGSISKVFTSLLLAQAVTANRIDLNTPINDYLPFEMEHGDEITCQHLANHTSGLPAIPSNLFDSETIMANPYASYTDEKLESYLKGPIKLQSDVGSSYAYSNLAAGMLGYILTQVYETSYEQLLQDSIFQNGNWPMNQTSTDRNHFESIVQGLDYNGDPTLPWDFQALAGAGAIKSNVSDIMIFLSRYFDDSPDSYALGMKETSRVNPNLGIGLGWHIITNNEQNRLYFHNGGTQGFTSHLSYHLQSKSYVIILSNVSAFHPKMGEIDKLGFGLIKQLIAEKE